MESLKLPEDSTHQEKKIIIEDENVKIVGILSIPQNTANPIPGCRVVIIAHGFGNDKDSAMSIPLVQRLTRCDKFMTFRFDFRSTSGSEGELEKRKQTVEQYVEDFDIVMKYLNKQRFKLAGIIGHSLGLGMAVEWASRQNFKIPTIVNCSGPFMKPGGLKEKILKEYPDAQELGYFDQVLPNGTNLRVPFSAVTAMDNVDSSKISNTDTHMLSIYGLNDTERLIYGEMYTQVVERHSLRLINNADHNLHADDGYKQVCQIVGEWFSADSERKRFMNENKYVTAIPRWVDAEGVSNMRDCGGYICQEGFVRPRFLYRAANPARASEKGLNELKKLGIKTVVDLRSTPEITKAPGIDQDGIKLLHCPVFGNAEWTGDRMKEQQKSMEDPVQGFMLMYKSILKNAGQAFAIIVREILENKQPLIFHCSAGKDRTGMFNVLTLLLLEVDHDTICHEYELTTEGLVAEIPRLKQLALGDNKSQASEMYLQSLFVMSQSRFESCMCVLEFIKDSYGSARQWFSEVAGLADNEIEEYIEFMTIKKEHQYAGWEFVL